MTSVLDRTVGFLADRLDRRGFLGKAAVVGSAVVTSPLEFGLKPNSAYAAICNCSGSSCVCGSPCCDGYTEFCCTLDRRQRLPARHHHRRVVEGRRLAVLRRRRPVLPGLQRPVRLVRLRCQRRLQRRLLGHAVRLRAGQLQQPQGRLHPVPLRPVQPGCALRRPDRVPGRDLCTAVELRPCVRHHARAPTRPPATTTGRASTSRSGRSSRSPTPAAAIRVGGLGGRQLRLPALRASGSSSTPTSCTTASPSSTDPTCQWYYPAFGLNTGYDVTVPATAGSAPGVRLGSRPDATVARRCSACENVDVAGPIGVLESVWDVGGGKIRVGRLGRREPQRRRRPPGSGSSSTRTSSYHGQPPRSPDPTSACLPGVRPEHRVRRHDRRSDPAATWCAPGASTGATAAARCWAAGRSASDDRPGPSSKAS